MLTKKELIDFEKDIFDEYEKGNIKGVVHLSGDGEDELLEIFTKIKKEDWVFSSHRNHYHMLLKAGKEFTKDNIMRGESMHQYSKEHKVFTSGIVAGGVPIAMGVALGIKLKQQDTERKLKDIVKNIKGKDWEVKGDVKITPLNQPHVYCFLGDMASEMGTFEVCCKYAMWNKLPITFIIEDNGIAVYTDTKEAWGNRSIRVMPNIIHYHYTRKYSHHGTGRFIHF